MNSANESKGKLTDEQLEQVVSVLHEEQENSVFNQTMQEFDEQHLEEELNKEEESITVDAVVNPETGLIDRILPVSESEPQEEYDDDISDYFDLLDKIPASSEDLTFSEDNIANAVKNTYGSELDSNDIRVLASAIKKFEAENKITYNDMPPAIRTKISETIIQMKDAHGNAAYIGNKELRNQMAMAFMEAVLQESLTSKITSTMINLQNDIDKFRRSELSKVYSNTMLRQRHILEHDILDIANEVEAKDPNKAELMREVSKQFVQSYMYEDMYRTCRDSGKLRVKKFEIEKPKRVYEEFNMKYLKSKYSNKDISILEPVLRRNLPDTISDDYIRKFIIVFCKYCRNKNPNNLLDHTFMSYFITNITGLDLFNQKNEDEKAFYDLIINNIVRFIDLIKLKEGKQ